MAMKQYTINCSVDSKNTQFPENSYTVYDLEEVGEIVKHTIGKEESGITRVEIIMKDIK